MYVILPMVTFSSSLLSAQSNIIDTTDLHVTQLQINEASDANDYPRLANLLKRLIAFGYRDTNTYYGVAVALAMAGDKPNGVKYLDTSIQLGLNLNSDGGIAAHLLGINPDATIDSLISEVDKQSIQNNLKNGESSNYLLNILYLEDQGERELLLKKGLNTSPLLAIKIYQNDLQRRKSIYSMLDSNLINNPKDLEQAALILQHGLDTNDYLKAHYLALKSVKQGNQSARFLVAASLDRYLIAKKMPQKYGTQSFYNEKTKEEELFPVDPNVSDKERAEWNVTPIKDALKKKD